MDDNLYDKDGEPKIEDEKPVRVLA